MKVVSESRIVLVLVWALSSAWLLPVAAQDVDFGYVRGIGGTSDENAGTSRERLILTRAPGQMPSPVPANTTDLSGNTTRMVI